MCTCFRDATGNDVGDNITRLYPRKEQLADFAQTADRIQVGFTECTHAVMRCEWDNQDGVNLARNLPKNTQQRAHDITNYGCPRLDPFMAKYKPDQQGANDDTAESTP